MENILHAFTVAITLIGAVAFSISSGIMGAMIRYSKRNDITKINNTKEIKTAMVAMILMGLYLWIVFFELIR